MEHWRVDESRLGRPITPRQGCDWSLKTEIWGRGGRVRLTHRVIKGCLSNKTALAMIFKLAEAVEKAGVDSTP
jgi:hypothetical protein